MKHKNSVTQVYIQRDEVILPRLFKKAKSIATYPTTMKQLCTMAANMPTPYFFLSDDAALDYVRKRFLHGIIKKFSTSYKNKLFEALYKEVLDIWSDEKYKDNSLQSVVLMALSREAPCVGLTPFIIQLKITRKMFKKKNNE